MARRVVVTSFPQGRKYLNSNAEDIKKLKDQVKEHERRLSDLETGECAKKIRFSIINTIFPTRNPKIINLSHIESSALGRTKFKMTEDEKYRWNSFVDKMNIQGIEIPQIDTDIRYFIGRSSNVAHPKIGSDLKKYSRKVFIEDNMH